MSGDWDRQQELLGTWTLTVQEALKEALSKEPFPLSFRVENTSGTIELTAILKGAGDRPTALRLLSDVRPLVTRTVEEISAPVAAREGLMFRVTVEASSPYADPDELHLCCWLQRDTGREDQVAMSRYVLERLHLETYAATAELTSGPSFFLVLRGAEGDTTTARELRPRIEGLVEEAKKTSKLFRETRPVIRSFNRGDDLVLEVEFIFPSQ